MRKHRSYPIEFKRQVAQEYLAGETLHGLAKRHEINRNLVRIWVAKYETGSFDSCLRFPDITRERSTVAVVEQLSSSQGHLHVPRSACVCYRSYRSCARLGSVRSVVDHVGVHAKIAPEKCEHRCFSSFGDCQRDDRYR
jgi:transposase